MRIQDALAYVKHIQAGEATIKELRKELKVTKDNERHLNRFADHQEAQIQVLKADAEELKWTNGNQAACIKASSSQAFGFANRITELEKVLLTASDHGRSLKSRVASQDGRINSLVRDVTYWKGCLDQGRRSNVEKMAECKASVMYWKNLAEQLAREEEVLLDEREDLTAELKKADTVITALSDRNDLLSKEIVRLKERIDIIAQTMSKSATFEQKKEVPACKWQERISNESQRGGASDCIRDWHTGRMFACRHPACPTACPDYEEDR